MGAPVLETVRAGVRFTPSAAASFRRAEAHWGSRIDVNSTYRDYDKQLAMYNAWQRYVKSGYNRALYPGHSRALHPDLSMHCRGLALDSDDWQRRGFAEVMAEHGWIRTAASDPTERHHFEYQSWRDQHRDDSAPAGGGSVVTPKPETPDTPELEDEEDDMPKSTGIATPPTPAIPAWRYLIFNYGSGIGHEFSGSKSGTPINGATTGALAVAFDTPPWAEVSESHYNRIVASLNDVQRIEIVS